MQTPALMTDPRASGAPQSSPTPSPTYLDQPAIPRGGLIVISGDSGVGKTHTIRQCLLDPQWGPDKIRVSYAENPMATIGEDTGAKHFKRVRTIQEFVDDIESLCAAKARGDAFPWSLMFLDSLTGLADYQFMDYEDHPDRFVSWNEKRGEMVKNEYAKYGDFGMKACRACVRARDELGVDFVIFATTYGRPPIYTLPGNIVPQNLNRWSSVCAYMEAQLGDAPSAILAEIEAGRLKPGLHQSISTDENGRADGKIVSRFFTTMNTGEVLAKGHRNLGMREKAILPNLLRKIHSTQPNNQNKEVKA